MPTACSARTSSLNSVTWAPPSPAEEYGPCGAKNAAVE